MLPLIRSSRQTYLERGIMKLRAIRSIEDELEKESYSGIWNMCGKDQKLLGACEFEPTEAGTLEVRGGLLNDSDDIGNPLAVVQGRCEGFAFVTLFDVVLERQTEHHALNVGSEIKARYRCHQGWVGDRCFESREEVVFDSVAFRITNLETWHNAARSFNMDYVRGSITYCRPEAVDLYEDDCVVVKLMYDVVWSALSIQQTEAQVRHFPYIQIKAKRGRLPYYGEGTVCYASYVKNVSTVLGLLMGMNASVYDIRGYFDAGEPKMQEFRLMLGRDLPSSLKRRYKIDQVFLKCAAIGGAVKDVIGRYFGLSGEARKIAETLVYLKYARRMIPPGGVPELIFIFEGLARELYGEECRIEREKMPGFKEHEDKKRMVLECLASDEELRQWTEARLKFRPVRLDRLFFIAREKVKGACPTLTNETAFRAFVEYLRARRDGYAHSEQKELEHEAMYLPTYYWLQTFLIVMILAKIGVSDDLLRCNLFNIPEFRWANEVYETEFIN